MALPNAGQPFFVLMHSCVPSPYRSKDLSAQLVDALGWVMAKMRLVNRG